MGEILVEEYRAETLECVHRGHICGVGSDGAVKYKVGDENYVAYLRSSAKPVQAIPAIKRGMHEKFGFTGKEIAIMAGSHRAEPFHVDALESIMAKTGLSEDHLVCHPTYPLSEPAKEQLVRQYKEKRRIYHNCSGKHLGILSLCKGAGYSLEDYWSPDHPVQREIKETLAYLADMPHEQIAAGTDGCGLPVFALPLANLARVYLKLACPDLIGDAAVRDAVRTITASMNDHGEMVAGTDRICSALLQDRNIIAKGGAKGIYCFGLKEERLAFALKVLDGSEDEWIYIVISILEQIGYKNKATLQRLREQFPAEIKNDNQKTVGYNKAVFRLQSV